MGVKIKMGNSETLKTLASLGIPEHAAKHVLDSGVDCTITSTSIAFSHNNGLYEKAVFQPGILTLAKKGALKKNSLEHLQHMVQTTFKKVEEKMGAPEVPGPGSGDDEIANVFKEPLIKSSQKKHAPAPAANSISDTEIKKMMSSSKLPLTEAEHMYQPISGTNSESKYFLIARSHDLKVAARVKNGKLSIRIEGDVQNYKDELATLGISMASDAHASMHLEVGNQDMARRTIGSVLFGLNMNWETPAPKVDFLWNQGA